MDEGILPANQPPAAAPPPLRPSGRGGRGSFWMVLALVLIALLGLSLLFNFFSVLGNLAGGPIQVGAPRLDEVTLESNQSRDKIAVIPVEGLIMSAGVVSGHRDMVKLIEDQLKMAAADGSVKAVLLRVDSPGGEVLASDDIARAITAFQKKTRKPVVAAMGSIAASGGYYVAAPCRWIVANELTITGSIGVIMNGLNYRGLMDKVGLRPQVFKSGRFKDMLSGSRDLANLTPEEKEIVAEETRMLNMLIGQTYGRFKQVVETGRSAAAEANRNNTGGTEDRGRALIPKWADYADGRIFSGKDAYEMGFVDEVGTGNDAIKRTLKLAGIRNADLVTYRPPADLAELLGLRLFGKSEAATVKIDLGFDAPRLKIGHLYFLSPNVLP
jgi:protease-4